MTRSGIVRFVVVLTWTAGMLVPITSGWGLDYVITRTFDLPLGRGNAPDWTNGDFLSYDSQTGEVVYLVASKNQGLSAWSQFWWPPDLVSNSGSLIAGVANQPVPLDDFMPPELRTQEIINGQVVPGSNGLHVEYDGYKYWPIWPDASTFQMWGVEGVLTSWSYGRLLPEKLSESFLLDDLYAFPDMQLIYLTVSGDVSHDGDIDARDLDELSLSIRHGIINSRYDLNSDGIVSDLDLRYVVERLMGTWFGDANLDGQFNSTDLVDVLAAGTYEADVDAGWSNGDFDGSGRFDSTDLMAALADGGYEQGPRPVAVAVPEPSAFFALNMAILGVVLARRSGPAHTTEVCAGATFD
jgi:hypothetical protein